MFKDLPKINIEGDYNLLEIKEGYYDNLWISKLLPWINSSSLYPMALYIIRDIQSEYIQQIPYRNSHIKSSYHERMEIVYGMPLFIDILLRKNNTFTILPNHMENILVLYSRYHIAIARLFSDGRADLGIYDNNNYVYQDLRNNKILPYIEYLSHDYWDTEFINGNKGEESFFVLNEDYLIKPLYWADKNDN